MKNQAKKELRLQEANEKRLLAIKNLRNRSISQQKLISESLKSLDAPRNKVVRFESSDEETDSRNAFNFGVAVNVKKPFNQLFSDDESDQKHDLNHADTDPKFAVSQKYSGSAGQKLLAQQSKISGDSRFKMDAKFLVDYEQNEEKATMERKNIIEAIGSDNDFDQERGQQLNILERVLGKTIKSQRRPKNEEQFDLDDNLETHKSQKKSKNPFMVRFDPDNPTHYKYKKSSDKNGINEVENLQIDKKNLRLADELLEHLDLGDESRKLTKQEKIRIAESAYEVDQQFLNRLKNRSMEKNDEVSYEKGFSLLAALGRKDIGIPSTSDDGTKSVKVNDDKVERKIPEWKRSLLNPRIRRKSNSSSSSEQEDLRENDSKIEEEKIKRNSNLDNSVLERTLFFVFDDEKVLAESDKFHCAQKEEDIRKKWSRIRPFLVKAYKKKHKDLIRNLRKMKNKQPRTEQDEKQQNVESRRKRSQKGPQRRNRLQC
uniref:Nucleolar protein 8 n=1 Tax=Romanomermis culicivorax TaxID=13658 RepID=A0A915J7Y8_ROMCU